MATETLPMPPRGRYSMAPPLQPGSSPVGEDSRQREPMPHTIPSYVRRAFVGLMAGVLGCSSDILLPDPPGGGENVALSKVTGDEQVGTVGEQLRDPFVVRVLTQRELPAPGRQVAFVITTEQATGSVSPDTATTNSEGQAIARLTLGTTPGSYAVVAHLVGGESEDQIAEFRAAAKAAAPDTLSPLSTLAQPGRREQAVGTPPQVRVVDRFGNPVQDVPVAWQVTAGEGLVSVPISITDADGHASVEWTLGNWVGVHKLTASIGSARGSPVTFTAHVLF
jgi:hypothetical protein